eukprot:CAMPEP_0205934392 /NCGR_PEP_ID=MMETSP1325-20131115/36279_1 /ASSEMBLY_ACC=CAM_ASM_000708 /TAXON_ID=236786 /ORGANISM="Florenciella sp., Strain RCC1007" /LENGTH=36 /DNA_ID= /DNA_START= /DNA_END= /DNA_ORIENTATION=
MHAVWCTASDDSEAMDHDGVGEARNEISCSWEIGPP